MELLPISQAQRKAAQIEQIAGQIASFVHSQLSAIHELTMSDPSGIIEVFGNKAAQSLEAYEIIRASLEQAMGVHAPAFSESFAANPDGTVTYTPPAVDPGETFEPLD